MAQLVGSNSLGLGKLIDGKNQFVHIMYSANVDGSNMTADIQADTKYIGIVTSNSETAPTNPSDYSWGRFVGTSGTSSYTWLRYSPNEDGSNMTANPTPETKYIGVAITADNNAPTDYTKYSWALIKGDDGRGISKTEVTYQKSTSGTVIPTGTWVTTIPTVNAGEYLWTRTLFTYTDNTTSSTYSVARSGVTGLGISRSDVDYQKSTSGTVAPTGAWAATIPTVAANEYLWTRTTLTYTNATTSVSYSVGKMGADGKDAQLLYLTASSQIQSFDKDDRPKTTQAITISAKLQNASGTATFVAIPYIGNVAQTAITLGGTGNDRTLLPSQWTNTQWTTIAITATLGSLTDTISVIKVKDGDTGAKGSDGIAGKDGVGVSNTNITYAQSTSGTTPPTTGWSAQVPTLVKGQYLWTRTIWSYTDNTTETGYTVSYNAKDGNDGSDGIAGKDGVGIASTKVEYVGSSSGTVKPTTGWSTTIPTVAEGNYLWTKTTWTYTDGTSEMGYSVAKMGAKGDKGDTGPKGDDGIAGKDGVGLKETVIRYAGSSNGTTAPASGWQSTVPFVPAGDFLWTRIIWTYTDNTSEIGYTVSRIGADGNNGKDGIAGKDGTGILSTTITYASSTSGTTAPTSGWTTTIPTVADGNYLWTKTVWAYTDNTSETGYSVAKMGARGADGRDGVAGKDGVGIKNTAIQYASSTSGTTAPTTGWQISVPTVAAGNYLWTKTTWTYTDDTTEVGYTVSRIGKDGNTGKDGIAGKDGVGIKATSIQYAGSTSGTTPPTTGWTASVPTVASGSYLWTKTTWSYTDDTSETGYSVSKMGETGAKGDTGASATSYWVTPSVNAIQISTTKVLNPTTITFTGYSKTGTANAGLYAGRFNILTSVDGIIYSSKYSSSANESAYTYTVPADVKFIKAKMYQAGSNSILVDEVTIPIIESAEGLEIGGRNLQLDTFNFSSKAFRSLPSTVVVTKEATGSWVEVATGVTTTELNFVDIGENQQFTVSFDCMTTNTTINSTQMMLVQYFNSSGTRINYEWVYGSYGNSWKRFNLTSTTPAGTTKIGLGLRSTSNSLRYRLVKLELGNKATAWTPALEDAQLYTAWSNDPNGKDMVRVYPNENLVKVDTSQITTGTRTAWDYTPVTSNQYKIPAVSGRTYYGMIWLESVSSVALRPYLRFYDSDLKQLSEVSLNSKLFSVGDTPQYLYVQGTAPANSSSVVMILKKSDGTTSQTLSWKNLKISDSENIFPYTPNPEIDPIKAEMAYIGYSPKDSNDPKDYVWSENPKAKGTFKRWANSADGTVDFIAQYPNENLFTITRPEVKNPAATKAEFLNNPNWDMAPIFDSYGAGIPYTLSFDLKSAVAGAIQVYSQNGSGSKYNIGTTSIQATTEFQRFTVTFTPQLQTGTTQTQALLAFYGVYDSGRVPTVRNLKLELGSVATLDIPSVSEDLLATIPQYVGIGSKDTMNPADFVWNINPEYNQARTDLGLDSKVDDETFNDAQDHMNEVVDGKADAQELQDLKDMADNLQQSYEGFVSEGGKHEADLQALEARVEGLIFELDEQVAAFDFVKTHMRLGEEGFEIAEEGSTMKMLLNNNTLSFIDGGKEVASFSNQKFIINQGAIVESLQVGSHKMSRLSDKVTVFQYAPKTTVTK